MLRLSGDAWRSQRAAREGQAALRHSRNRVARSIRGFAEAGVTVLLASRFPTVSWASHSHSLWMMKWSGIPMIKFRTVTLAVVALLSVSVPAFRVVAAERAEMACGKPPAPGRPIKGGKHPRLLPPLLPGGKAMEGSNRMTWRA